MEILQGRSSAKSKLQKGLKCTSFFSSQSVRQSGTLKIITHCAETHHAKICLKVKPHLLSYKIGTFRNFSLIFAHDLHAIWILTVLKKNEKNHQHCAAAHIFSEACLCFHANYLRPWSRISEQNCEFVTNHYHTAASDFNGVLSQIFQTTQDCQRQSSHGKQQ